MTIRVINAGLQTTLQSAPFSRHRHIGMPAAGAADSLSLSLANRLVGNELSAPAMEITLSGAKFGCEESTTVALTGGKCDIRVNDEPCDQHDTIGISPGDILEVGVTKKGCRTYLAIKGGFDAESVLGGKSTYQPAGLGGYQGRALKSGDILQVSIDNNPSIADNATPDHMIPAIRDSVILRVTAGPEITKLSDRSKVTLYDSTWLADPRMNRMGVMLSGTPLETNDNSSMSSAPVFSGTIQCPPEGLPFLLGPDAQTTGGYPRIAQVIRADRHLIGQLKPGSSVQLVQTTSERAAKIYREKLALLKPWLGECSLW